MATLKFFDPAMTVKQADFIIAFICVNEITPTTPITEVISLWNDDMALFKQHNHDTWENPFLGESQITDVISFEKEDF